MDIRSQLRYPQRCLSWPLWPMLSPSCCHTLSHYPPSYSLWTDYLERPCLFICWWIRSLPLLEFGQEICLFYPYPQCLACASYTMVSEWRKEGKNEVPTPTHTHTHTHTHTQKVIKIQVKLFWHRHLSMFYRCGIWIYSSREELWVYSSKEEGTITYHQEMCK